MSESAVAQRILDKNVIVPFGRSVMDCFKRMLGVEITIGRPRLRVDNTATHDVSGIVGYSGDIVGYVVVSFSLETARKLVEKFAGYPINVDSSDFTDGIGEFSNWVVGGAKANLGGVTSMSCAAVVIGTAHKVAHLTDVPCIMLPCSCEYGEFCVEVNVKRANAGGGNANEDSHR